MLFTSQFDRPCVLKAFHFINYNSNVSTRNNGTQKKCQQFLIILTLPPSICPSVEHYRFDFTQVLYITNVHATNHVLQYKTMIGINNKAAMALQCESNVKLNSCLAHI